MKDKEYKTKILQVRLTEEEFNRIQLSAKTNHLNLSAWGRQAIFEKLEEEEKESFAKSWKMSR